MACIFHIESVIGYILNPIRGIFNCIWYISNSIRDISNSVYNLIGDIKIYLIELEIALIQLLTKKRCRFKCKNDMPYIRVDFICANKLLIEWGRGGGPKWNGGRFGFIERRRRNVENRVNLPTNESTSPSSRFCSNK